MQFTVLFVDDDKAMLERLALRMNGREYVFITANSFGQAREVLQSRDIDIALIDINLGAECSGLTLLDHIQRSFDSVICLMATADNALASVRDSIARGACGYIRKPYGPDDLSIQLEIAKTMCMRNRGQCFRDGLPGRAGAIEVCGSLIGQGEAMNRVRQQIAQVAKFHATSILITGESGTGKEMVARAIHRGFGDRKRPFVAINCAALPANLIESELFGHERGAFTGAVQRKIGCVELADKGDLFLDEIGEMPVDAQAKLLRVLQEKEFKRVGGECVIASDFRLISATNQDLRSLIDTGKFRKDLYYRIFGFPIALPALRERREDIPLLIDGFIAQMRQKFGKHIVGAEEELIQSLCAMDWDGNIRALRSTLEYLCIKATGALLRVGDMYQHALPAPADLARVKEVHVMSWLAAEARSVGLMAILERVERGILASAVDLSPNQAKAAELLRIRPNTLSDKMRRLQVRAV